MFNIYAIDKAMPVSVWYKAFYIKKKKLAKSYKSTHAKSVYLDGWMNGQTYRRCNTM